MPAGRGFEENRLQPVGMAGIDSWGATTGMPLTISMGYLTPSHLYPRPGRARGGPPNQAKMGQAQEASPDTPDRLLRQPMPHGYGW